MAACALEVMLGDTSVCIINAVDPPFPIQKVLVYEDILCRFVALLHQTVTNITKDKVIPGDSGTSPSFTTQRCYTI